MTTHQRHTHRLIRLTPPDATTTLFGCTECFPEYAWRAEQKLCLVCGRPGCPRDHVPRRSPDPVDTSLTGLMVLVGAALAAAVVAFLLADHLPTWATSILAGFAGLLVVAIAAGRWLFRG